MYKCIIKVLVITLGLQTAPLQASENEYLYVSMGGVGYTASCQPNGQVLRSVNDTIRIRGYRSSTERKRFENETLVLMPNCSVTSPELGQGQWCAHGGSNAGFEIDFLDFGIDDELSPNRMEFFGQEAGCEGINIMPCFCE